MAEGRTLQEMYREAVDLVRIYVLFDARQLRHNGRQHAYAMRKAAGQRKRAAFLAYCIRRDSESKA